MIGMSRKMFKIGNGVKSREYGTNTEADVETDADKAPVQLSSRLIG